MEYDQKQFKRILKVSEIKKNFNTLTPREKEVCALLVEGLMNKEIAERMADLYEAKGYFNVRIQAIPFHKGCESDLAKQFMGVK